jgi:hypothetical protein
VKNTNAALLCDLSATKSQPASCFPGFSVLGSHAEYFLNFIACNFDSILVKFSMMTGGKNEKIDFVTRIDFDVYVVPGI